MRLLIIDDNDDLRFLLRAHFKQHGTKVLIDEAGSVTSGLRKLSTGKFDWLILDYNLPGGSGLSILEYLHLPATKVILYTSAGDNHHLRLEALCLGVDSVFSKSKPVGEIVEYIMRNSVGG